MDFKKWIREIGFRKTTVKLYEKGHRSIDLQIIMFYC